MGARSCSRYGAGKRAARDSVPLLLKTVLRRARGRVQGAARTALNAECSMADLTIPSAVSPSAWQLHRVELNPIDSSPLSGYMQAVRNPALRAVGCCSPAKYSRKNVFSCACDAWIIQLAPRDYALHRETLTGYSVPDTALWNLPYCRSPISLLSASHDN